MLAPLHIADLPDDVVAVRAIALAQNQIARQLWEQLEIVKHQLAQFMRARFGASSEQLSGQAELFVDTVALPVPPPEPATPVAGHLRRGRPALPKELPRERIEYDLTQVEKAEFDCLERIGEEVSETLDYTPAKLTVIEHVRIKYACRKDGESTVRTAFVQPSPLPKSNASAGLLAQIGVATFVDHMPLHRQAIAYARKGIVLPGSTLCDWKLGTAELIEVLMPALKKHILAAPIVHSDDTTMPVREPGRSSTRTARLWGYLVRAAAGEWTVGRPPAGGAVRLCDVARSDSSADFFCRLHGLFARGRLQWLPGAVPQWSRHRGRLMGTLSATPLRDCEDPEDARTGRAGTGVDCQSLRDRGEHQTPYPGSEISGAPAAQCAATDGSASLARRAFPAAVAAVPTGASLRLRVAQLGGTGALYRRRCPAAG